MLRETKKHLERASVTCGAPLSRYRCMSLSRSVTHPTWSLQTVNISVGLQNVERELS